jgi:prepilin-type N-terminal cleavage/methylation domain-containing protein
MSNHEEYRMSLKHTSCGRGFTLIEIVTSLSIMSVLMIGLSGAILVGSYAIPTPADTGYADQVVIDAITQLRSDLREATTVRHRSRVVGDSIQLTIKDTGASGVPTTVTYIFVDATDEFTRQVDALTPVTIITGVDAFAVTLTTDSGDLRVFELLMSVTDTIERVYEMHALLPDKPGVL